MDLKKILALAMIALVALPSLTMAVADDGGAGPAGAIERARIYLDKVMTSAEKTASEYPEDHIIHGYLNELYALLGRYEYEGPEILFQTGDSGLAEWSTEVVKSGLISAYLSDAGAGYTSGDDYGAGRVVIPVDILLADVDRLSYWFNYDVPDTTSEPHPDFQAFPYMILECDADGGDEADLWIVLISTTLDTGGYMPTENEWVQWDLTDYDNWHDAGPGATGDVGTPTNGDTLAAMKEAYPEADILSVKVAVGEWASGSYDAITAYVDDINIGGTTYDFEEREEEEGQAKDYLDQASDYLDEGDIKSAARSLASARNILGRVNGLLKSMAKAHKVTRTEKFNRRIQGIKDKIERPKGPKK